MYDKIKSIFGGVDVLINNAGISLYSEFLKTDDDDWDKVINTNLKSVYYVTKAFLPYMITNRYGKIINIGSIWGQTGAAMETVYSASKGGIHALTKALAKELALSNINVNCISPGFIETEMNSVFSFEEKKEIINNIPLNRAGTPEDVANLCYFLASEEASYITGQIIAVNGGMFI